MASAIRGNFLSDGDGSRLDWGLGNQVAPMGGRGEDPDMYIRVVEVYILVRVSSVSYPKLSPLVHWSFHATILRGTKTAITVQGHFSEG